MNRTAKSQWDFGELFPPEETRKVLSVAELTGQVRRLLEKQIGQVWVTGEITMKMINSTSSTSMSGVTLMFAFWPPLGPTAIPMVVLLYWPGAGAAGAGGALGPVFL